MINILVAADDDRSRRILHDFLKRENFNVITAISAVEASDFFRQKHEMLDLVVLDVAPSLPDDSDIVTFIKETDNTIPVIMLINKNSYQTNDNFTSADDYITKPLSPIMLVSRVKMLIKKSIESQLNTKRDYNGLVIDETGHSIYIKNNLIDLTPREYDLLVYLAKNEGIALSREQLINTIWGIDYAGDLRTLDTHIKNLRAKLGKKDTFIKTTRGYGYKFQP